MEHLAKLWHCFAKTFTVTNWKQTSVCFRGWNVLFYTVSWLLSWRWIFPVPTAGFGGLPLPPNPAPACFLGGKSFHSSPVVVVAELFDLPVQLEGERGSSLLPTGRSCNLLMTSFTTSLFLCQEGLSCLWEGWRTAGPFSLEAAGDDTGWSG